MLTPKNSSGAPIRAAFFDIDGTLLPFDAQKVPRDTCEALAALRQNGVRLYIATGRPPVRLPVLDGIQFDGYVTMNGQFCYEQDPAHPFYRRTLPRDAMRTLVPWLARTQLPVAFVEENFVYANTQAAAGNGFFVPEVPVIDPAERVLTHDTYQLSAFFPARWQDEFMAHCPGCTATRWNPDFADILPEGGGKPAGIGRVLERLGLGPENAIAFGDAENDLAMLRYVGLGVAMGNADARVRREASYVTTACDAGGIAGALRHFGLIG